MNRLKLDAAYRTVLRAGTALALTGVLLASAGCGSTDSSVNTKQGAVGGAALGAIAGGIIGHQSGRGLEGAAIGAAAGGAGGALLGSAKDEKQAQAGQPVVRQGAIATCPFCGAKNDVRDVAAGQSAQCGSCGKVFTP